MDPGERPSNPEVWARLHEICDALPDVSNRISHGETAWFVSRGKRSRQFATTSDHHHDDRNAIVMAAPPGVQQQLVADRPSLYFRPPYVGAQGWLGVFLDTDQLDWDLVERHIEDAHAVITERLARS